MRTLAYVTGCLCLWAMLLVSLPVQAQVGELRNDWFVGVNGGVNMSSVGFTPTVPQGTLMSPSLGVTFRYTCEKYFSALCSFQGEVNFGQHGWKENILGADDQKTGEEYSRTVSYVQIPLIARLAWGKETRGMQFFINLGPQVGFAFLEKETANFSFSGMTESDRVNGVIAEYGKKLENKFDYGILGGIGAELGTGIGRFGIEGRYYFGLGNIFKNSKRDPFSKSNNSAIEIRVSYLTDFHHVFKKRNNHKEADL